MKREGGRIFTAEVSSASLRPSFIHSFIFVNITLYFTAIGSKGSAVSRSRSMFREEKKTTSVSPFFSFFVLSLVLCRFHNAFLPSFLPRIPIQERTQLLYDHALCRRCDREGRRRCCRVGDGSSSTDPRRRPPSVVDAKLCNRNSWPPRRLCPRSTPCLRPPRRRHWPGDLRGRHRRPPGRGRGRGRRFPLRDGADRRRRDRRRGRALPAGDAGRLPAVRGGAAGRDRRVSFFFREKERWRGRRAKREGTNRAKLNTERGPASRQAKTFPSHPHPRKKKKNSTSKKTL